MFSLPRSPVSTSGSLVNNVHGGTRWPDFLPPALSPDDFEFLRGADPGFSLRNSFARQSLHHLSATLPGATLLGRTPPAHIFEPTYEDIRAPSKFTTKSVEQTPPRRTGQRDSRLRAEVPTTGFLSSGEDSLFSTDSKTPPHDGDLFVKAPRRAIYGAVCAPKQHGWTLSPVLSTPSLSSSPYSPYVPSPTSLASSSPDPSFTPFANVAPSPSITSIFSPSGITTPVPVQQNKTQHSESSPSASTFRIKKTAARIIQVDAAHIPLIPGSMECPVQGCGYYQQNPNRRPDLRRHVSLHTQEYNLARGGPKWACCGITVEEAIQRGEDVSTARAWGGRLMVGGCMTTFSSKNNYQRHMRSHSCLRSGISPT